jgi:hypothetical protein
MEPIPIDDFVVDRTWVRRQVPICPDCLKIEESERILGEVWSRGLHEKLLKAIRDL